MDHPNEATLAHEERPRGCSSCEETDTFKHAWPNVNMWLKTCHVTVHIHWHPYTAVTCPIANDDDDDDACPVHNAVSHPHHVPSPDSHIPIHNDRLLPSLHVAATAYVLLPHLCALAATPMCQPLTATTTCCHCWPHPQLPLLPFTAPWRQQGGKANPGGPSKQDISEVHLHPYCQLFVMN